MSPSLFPPSLPLLLLLHTLTLLTHALPPPTNPLTLTTPTTNPTNHTSSPSSFPPHLLRLPTCVPKRTFFTKCPEYYDCLDAILNLPDRESWGAFHNGDPDDGFRLPVERTRRSCRVRVEMVHEGGSREAGSWHVVVARALRVAQVCINTPLRAPEHAGGWTLLGKHQRLQIWLEHESVRGDSGYGGGNGTGLGGDGGGNVTVV